MQNVGASIRDTLLKIKAFFEGVSGDLLVALLFIVVTFLAFGLGRLSALEEQKPKVSFESTKNIATEPQKEVFVPESGGGQGGAIVASKKGTKYHFPWCAGAQTMSEENKIWFTDEAAARAAGYTPAGNCKGLQ